MAYRFQFRGDEEANWTGAILADREIGILIKNGKNTNLYKIGDGKKPWEDLPYFGFDGSISSKLTAEENERTDLTVLNKKVVIDEFANINLSIDDLIKSLTDTQSELDNVKLDIGTREGDDIYTKLNNVKLDIGERGESKNIYTELGGLKTSVSDINTSISDINGAISERHQTRVIDSITWEGIASNPDNIWEDVLYFVYE